MACLSGGESRRWTVLELVERFKNLGVCASRASVTAALAELGRSESRSDSLSYRARPFDFKLATLPILRLIAGLTFETRILAIMHSSIDLQELEDESREVEEEFKKRSPNRSMKRLTRRTGGLTPTGP
jgi:hypothetical protein